MECREARQLIDRGIGPGSRTPTSTQLGFHLAGCPACRTYQQAQQQAMLATLLFEHTPDRAAPKPQPVPSVRRTPRQVKRVGLIIASLIGMVVVLLVGRVALAALTIRQNVQTYIVPPRTTAGPTLPTQAVQPQRSIATTIVLPTLPIPTRVPALPTAQAPLGIAESLAGLLHQIQRQPAPMIIPIVPTSAVAGAAPVGSIPTLAAVTATARVPLAGAPVTILLLGSDGRPGEEGPTRTDTVIVLRIDPGLQRVAMLSIPRDLIVAIPGYGYGRINAAHVYGDLYPELGGGLALTRATVAKLLGVPIDYAVLVDFSGFIGLIDSIGGIDLNVPTALYDGEYPTMDYGYMEVAFTPGMQHMDGERALQYARIRHMDSDFERARRQQEVILAAARHVREQNPLELLDTLTSATAAMRGYVQTDIPEDRMVGLAWALRNMRTEAAERYLLDENMISFNGEGGGCSGSDDYWAACADPTAIRALVQQWLGEVKN